MWKKPKIMNWMQFVMVMLIMAALLFTGFNVTEIRAEGTATYTASYAYDCWRTPAYPAKGDAIELYKFSVPLGGALSFSPTSEGKGELVSLGKYDFTIHTEDLSDSIGDIVADMADVYGITAKEVDVFALKKDGEHVCQGVVAATFGNDGVFFIGTSWSGGAGYYLCNQELAYSDTINTTVDSDCSDLITESHNHCICGIKHTSVGEHTAEDKVTWNAWTTADSLPSESGYYYLTTDVILTETWEPADGTYLCLNGQKISCSVIGTNYYSAITVDNGVTFALTDCNTTERVGYVDASTKLWTEGTSDVEGNITTNLIGGVITGGTGTISSSYTSGGAVYNNGTFVMYGGNLAGNAVTSSGAGIYNKGSVIMNGGSITGNKGRGVYNAIDDSTFVLNSGKICANSKGGVENFRGSFTMNGGDIVRNGNFASTGIATDGAGVAIKYGSFTMNGGRIIYNSANGESTAAQGGGVRNESGIFTMNGGEIAYNFAKQGGGVVAVGEFHLKGGSIQYNTASVFAGGVLVNDDKSVILYNNPSIENNALGGTITANDDFYTLTGGTSSNLYFRYTQDGSVYTINRILIDNSFAPTNPISFSITDYSKVQPTATLPVAITGTNSKDYSNWFVSEKGEKVYNIDNVLYLHASDATEAATQYEITQENTSNGSFKVTVNNEEKCKVFAGEKITIVATPDSGYEVTGINVYKTGDENITIEVIDGAFTMPAYPVTVSVTFNRYAVTVEKDGSTLEAVAVPEEEVSSYAWLELGTTQTEITTDNATDWDSNFLDGKWSAVDVGPEFIWNVGVNLVYFSQNEDQSPVFLNVNTVEGEDDSDVSYKVILLTAEGTMEFLNPVGENRWLIPAGATYMVGALAPFDEETGAATQTPSITANITTLNVIEGATTNQFENPIDGKTYICAVTYKDGRERYSASFEYEAEYTITKTETTNGKFSVKVNGSEVTTVVAGKTVSITTTANTGYEVDEIIVHKTGDSNTKIEVTNGEFIMPAYEVTISVTFKPCTYTVTLNTNDGTVTPEKNVTSYTYGVGATLPTDVTKSGYTFVGWYENSDFSGDAVTNIGTSETGNKTYYAQWTKIPAETPELTIKPTGVTFGYTEGDAQVTVSVVEETGHTYEYQWYQNITNTNSDGTAINGATSATYVLPKGTKVGDYYYYCVVTATRTDNGESATATTGVATVTISPKTLTHAMIGVNANGEYPYTGNEIAPVITVTDGTVLVVGTDYEVTGDTSKTAYGTYTLLVTGKGNYIGTVEVSWNIKDTTAPTGKIKVADKSWNSILNEITFDLFFKETQSVTITGDDGEEQSGVGQIYYYLSETQIDEADIADVEWVEYNGSFDINPDNKYVVYAKIIDVSGNVTYLSSNGMILDATAPSITGVTDGNIYCKEQTITVVDENLDTVTVNGSEVELTNGSYTLTADGTIYTIEASDKAGNRISVEVTINAGHTSSDWKTSTTDHWKICTVEGCGVEIEGSREEHSDDKTDGDYLCDDCGYVLHTHDLELVPKQEATCTKDGHEAYYQCKGDCGELFEDEDGTTATTLEAVKIKRLNHKLSEATCTEAPKCERDGCDYTEGEALGHEMSEATCTEASKCNRKGCNHTEGKALGHEMSEATCEEAPTCKRDGCGYTEGTALGHDMSEATCEEAPKCERDDCDYTEGTALGHDMSEATCEEAPKCQRENCDYTEGEALGHEMSEATCTEAPKCKRDGCDYTTGEALGHEMSEATCTEAPKCKRDGCDYTTGEALGHEMSEATCTEAPKCQREDCDHTEGKALGHEMSEATCEEAPKCQRENCDYTEDKSLGHEMSEATCTEAPKCQRENCDYTEGEALGHEMSEATCTEASKCQRENCDYTEGKALGHEMSEATCEEAPKCQRKNCDYTEGKALGHEMSEATCTEAPKCQREGCDHTEGKALGHEMSEATCTEAPKCQRKNCEYTEGKSLGHEMREATCTEAPKCQRENCHYTEGEALDHEMSEATCTEAPKCQRENCHYTEGKALGHEMSEATCTEASKCQRENCDYTEGEALGHEMSEATCTEAPKCQREGCDHTEGKALGHEMSEATCTEAPKCQREDCDHTEGKALGHEMSEATCEEAPKCQRKNCDYTEGKALGHEMSEATCEEAPKCQRKNCDYTEGKALGHEMSEATCTEAPKCQREDCDYTEGKALGHEMSEATCMEASKCNREGCNHTEGKALGHEMSEATCTEAPKCQRENCDYTEGEALDHEMSEATCTEAPKCQRKNCDYTEGKALGHEMSEATCTEASKCQREGCDHTEGKALGHDMSEATCEEAPKCQRENCDYTEGKALGHEMSEATCTEAPKCQRENCDYTEGEALGHEMSEATCTEASKCQRENCDYAEGKALGHEMSEATCTEAPKCQRKNCDYTEGEALGHEMSEATCTEAPKCQREDCDHTEGKALGHEMSEATCTEASKCQRENCDYTEGEALGHEMSEATCEEAPTCKRDGCDHTEGEALGHEMSEATCEEAPMCKRDGCDHTEGEALGHEMSEATCEEASTCKREGCDHTTGTALGHEMSKASCTEASACQREGCDYTEAALGHEWSGEWTVIKESTATEDGKKETLCTRGCGQKKVVAIPMTGVDEDEGALEVDVEVEKDAPIEEVILNNSKSELIEAEGIFTEAEKVEVQNGADARVWIEISKTDENAITPEDKETIENKVEEVIGNNNQIHYFDVDLFKQVGKGAKTQVSEPGVAMKIMILIPDNLLNHDTSITREYKVVRLHDGNVDVLSGTFDSATGEFTFESDQFSTYAIIYSDTPKAGQETPEPVIPNIPSTGDTSNAMPFMLLFVVGCVVINANKKKVR